MPDVSSLLEIQKTSLGYSNTQKWWVREVSQDFGSDFGTSFHVACHEIVLRPRLSETAARSLGRGIVTLT